ncbi:MAG: DUF3536 domain-containing protein [Chloroflexota bacterium]
MNRYICIHGHFYQPPRENPWLEAIELQDTAAPYHDWNERVTRECYAPNSVSRILDEQGRIVKLVNNYAQISFDFGPTLLSWLELKAPDVYDAILTADRQSRDFFSGHGSALAQVYNHLIMPLANRRDRATQVRWGIRDFEHRFGRAPEGMWLAETAVDVDTLEELAESGIRFTILAPHQAARVRRLGEPEWREINGDQIDTTVAYWQRLPSGRTIAIFFYNGAIARAVAFEGLLSHGEHFIDRLVGAFAAERDGPQLVHIATDGESYGHHHRFGDMALAYVLDQIEARQLAHLTNYGEYLEKYPPQHEVEIVENSSWSCAHGIDRWRSDCGCNTGADGRWHQRWRAPLRDALDWLRDQVAPTWEQRARDLFHDPWALRDAYIDVVLDRSAKNIESFFSRHALRPLTAAQITTALKLLELQRHAMLMYTSCGWFFDDLAGIETVQILQLAGRAVQLAQDLFGDSLEERFVHRLAAAESNQPEEGNGAQIYERRVRPVRVDWPKLAAHYALSNLFEDFPDTAAVYCYDARVTQARVFSTGRAKLGFGRVELTSNITLDKAQLVFAVLHLGDHNISAGVGENSADARYDEIVHALIEPFMRADLTLVMHEMERRFGSSRYSLRSLFRDEQRAVLNLILGATLQEAESLYRQIYESRAPLMRFLTDLGIPLPKGFSAAADFVINQRLRAAFAPPAGDLKRAFELLESARLEGIALDMPGLEFAYRESLEQLAAAAAANPAWSELVRLHEAASALQRLPFTVDLWRAQNSYNQILRQHYHPSQLEAERQNNPSARRWNEIFREIGRMLRVKVDE